MQLWDGDVSQRDSRSTTLVQTEIGQQLLDHLTFHLCTLLILVMLLTQRNTQSSAVVN